MRKKLLKKREFLKSRDWGAFLVWFVLSILIAGLLYLGIRCFYFHRSLFYVFNKEAYNGYFYAWAVSLLVGSMVMLVLLLLNEKEIKKENEKHKKHKVGKWIISSLLFFSLIGVVIYYVHYSEKVNQTMEVFVDSIKIDELRPSNIELKHDNIDLISDSINTEKLLNRIDNEQLKKALVHYNYEIVHPLTHINWTMILVMIISFVVSAVVFVFTHPKRQ